MTTIVLADDHAIVRQGIKLILERDGQYQVVGEAADGTEAIRLVEREHPEVLVVDLVMGAIDPFDVVRTVRRKSPETAVVVLSMHAHEGYVREALTSGASAYVLKSAGGGELVEAIRHVLQGQRYLSEPFSAQAIEAYARRTESTPIDAYELLSPREREVLQLAAEGHTNAEIGARLFISPRTVEVHRAKAMHKIGIKGPLELAHYAMRHGLLRTT